MTLSSLFLPFIESILFLIYPDYSLPSMYVSQFFMYILSYPDPLPFCLSLDNDHASLLQAKRLLVHLYFSLCSQSPSLMQLCNRTPAGASLLPLLPSPVEPTDLSLLISLLSLLYISTPISIRLSLGTHRSP